MRSTLDHGHIADRNGSSNLPNATMNPFPVFSGTLQPPQQPRQENPDANMSKADFYHLIRHQIENEDNLVNQRFIWMVFSQSFLFSAFAALLNAPEKAKSPVFGTLQDTMLWVIPCIAMLSCALIYISLVTSLITIRNIRTCYGEFPDDGTDRAFPSIHNNRMCRILAALPPIILPAIFFLTWLSILIFRVIIQPQA